jgi:hypothetical protein
VCTCSWGSAKSLLTASTLTAGSGGDEGT